MHNKVYVALFLTLFFLNNSWADTCKNKRETIRAYIVDDTNGTRSGPIRCLTSQKIMDQLKADKEKLEQHSQGTFTASGFAKPGEKYWTDLPADSIF